VADGDEPRCLIAGADSKHGFATAGQTPISIARHQQDFSNASFHHLPFQVRHCGRKPLTTDAQSFWLTFSQMFETEQNANRLKGEQLSY
jgi:hypothetical protein